MMLTERQVDKLIAKHLMDNVLRPYSTVIQAAWDVVEKLVTEGRGFNQWYKETLDGKRVWKVLMELHGVNYTVTHESAPMAFCLLALKSRGIKYDG